MLHVRAKERIRSGELPMYGPSRRFAGKGSTARCSLCDEPILPSEIEYELEFVGAEPSDRTVIWFHSQCEAIWDEERLRLRRQA